MESMVSVNKLGRLRVELHSRNFFHPSASREESDRDCDTKKSLRHCGMSRRNRWRLEQQDRQPAKNCLDDHGAKSADGQPSQPAPLLDQQRPKRDRQCERDQCPGHHAVAPLVAHAAHEVRHLHQIAEGSWPVRNREPSVVAGDERSRGDDDEGRTRREHGERMMRAIVLCRNGSQSVSHESGGLRGTRPALVAKRAGLRNRAKPARRSSYILPNAATAVSAMPVEFAVIRRRL